MKKVLFFGFIGLLLLALWAHHVWGGDTERKNPAANLPAVPVPPPFEINDLGGGLNHKDPPDGIADNEAVVCQNWIFDRTGALVTRPGFAKVNATAIDLSPVWGLYHYSIPNYGKGFLVGDSVFIYNMTDAGSFADSQISFPIYIRIPTGDSIATVIEPQDKWLLEKIAFRGDEVLLRDGVDAIRLNIKFAYYNVDSARYLIKFTSTANATINTSTTESKIRTRSADFTRGAFIQRNNTVIVGSNSHPAMLWDGKLASAVGVYSQGTIDTVKSLAGAARDTAIVCNNCNFTTNELAGKILTTVGFDGSIAYRPTYRIVTSNTANYIVWREVDSGFVPLAATVPFMVWSPVFTVVDSGRVDTVYQGTGANQNITNIKLIGRSSPYDDEVVGGRIIEFLTGPATGLLRVIRNVQNPTNTLSFYRRNGVNFDDDSKPRKGDRLAIYHIGLSARFLELYYDRLVAAGLDFFPNTIIYSAASNLHDFSPGTSFLTLPEQGGDSIVFLSNTNGLLAVGQKHRLWVLVGPPPWTGQTVLLASDGIGCVAPRSLVKDGKFLYFVGLRGNIPTVYRWQVEGTTVNTAGGGTLFQGGGLLEPLTVKIDPLMMKVDQAQIGKASAGLFGEHLLVSLPFLGSTVNDSTLAINLRTGAIAMWTLAGGLWHNGRAAGDSGQVYFTAATDTGWVYLFGGATDSLDLGQTFTTLYQSKIFDAGTPTVNKQFFRLWSRFFRSNASGTGTWNTRFDFSTSNTGAFEIGATAGEREENGWLDVNNFGKRIQFRFTGSGVRSSFRLSGLKTKYVFRGEER